MDHKQVVILGVLGVAAIIVWLRYYKRNHYASPPKHNSGYVVPSFNQNISTPLDPQEPQDPQEGCETKCFGSEYYDACMHTCMDPEGIYDFGVPITPEEEVSPYRYETPGK